MVIEAFDKSLYATVEDSMFALEEIPKVQLKSQNFDEILPTEPKKIYIPQMVHPFKRQSLKIHRKTKFKNYSSTLTPKTNPKKSKF